MLSVVKSSVFCLVLLGAAALRADTTVFAAGRIWLPVYSAADAGPEERAAATELARVLGVMSGLDWPVRTESAADRAGLVRNEEGGGAGFYIGHTRTAARLLMPLRPSADLLAPKADELGPDGFRICTRGERIFLEGATPEATANAVSWLLQHEGGVRWYAPGTIGEVIPRRTEWVLPELGVVREPAYVSREISGLESPAAQAWARHNGLRGRIDYSHNLLNVFPCELGAAHPEYFPLVQGRRVLPASKADYNWQPDLTSPEVAERAAQQASEAFAREPGRASFSLGMNDSVRFDQGAETQAAVTPLRYFRGMPDYSPLVLGFMNRSAEALGRIRPGKPGEYLGCLAYFWCENVPPFAVNSQVVPYVTTDRSQFYDADYRAADYALMSRWGRSGVRAFGLWEYGYGSAYIVPRLPQAAFAEAVREGWWRGARGYIADTGPHWGFDAFKVWMLTQLLWDPDRPVAELEADFFNGWYGPAAEPMRRFFARCEAQWLAQAGPPWWIKYYRQQDQPLLFPPEVCRELRGLLDEAERAAARPRPIEEGRMQNAEVVSGAKPEQLWRDAKFVATFARTSGRTADETLASSATGNCRGSDAKIVATFSENDVPASACKHADLQGQGSAIRADQCVLVVSPKPETRNLKLETPFSSRIALTSRAFAVTEAAVEFDRVRRALGAAESLAAHELAAQLVQLQRARTALERAARAAAKGEDGVSALASVDVAFLLRNDPVPRLLAALGQREATAPLAVLAEVQAAGAGPATATEIGAGVPMRLAVKVPAAWRDLAEAFADGRITRLKNRLPNGDFSRVAVGRQEPRFLYPRWGELPADWEVRGIATETGRVALVAREPGGVPALRIEGAWETQASTILPATPGRLHVLAAQMRGHSSPGNDAAMFLVFMNAEGRITGEYRTQTLPKGESDWRTLLLAAAAPADAAWVSVGVAALRQPAGDWLEAAAVALKSE